MSYDYLFKIIFVGDVHVGKTALTERLTAQRFTDYYHTTIGVDFSTVNLDIKEDKIKTHIWDTAGQECFSPIIQSYYRGIAGAVIVFDVTDRDSFIRVPFWLNEIKKNGNQNHIPVTILVGNKIDKKERSVYKDEIDDFAKNNNILYCETSAKENINVNKFYYMLIEKIYDTADLIDPDEKKGIRKGFIKHSKINVYNNRPCDKFECCKIV